MIRNKKRAIIVAVVAVVALAAAIGGYAYWTTTGSGSAAGNAATATSDLTINGSFPDGIYPGGNEPVSFSIVNPNPGSVQLGTISLQSVGIDSGHSPGCLPADFTMLDVLVNHLVTTGTHAITETGSLVMADTGVSQDACKGATITLNLTSN